MNGWHTNFVNVRTLLRFCIHNNLNTIISIDLTRSIILLQNVKNFVKNNGNLYQIIQSNYNYTNRLKCSLSLQTTYYHIILKENAVCLLGSLLVAFNYKCWSPPCWALITSMLSVDCLYVDHWSTPPQDQQCWLPLHWSLIASTLSINLPLNQLLICPHPRINSVDCLCIDHWSSITFVSIVNQLPTFLIFNIRML